MTPWPVMGRWKRLLRRLGSAGSPARGFLDTASAGHDAPPSDGSGPLVVAYEPSMYGDPDPGEVVWTWVSYEDQPSEGKDRPVVVIGWDGPQLGVVQLTSHDKERDDYLAVGSGGWDPRGRPSWAKLDRILRVDPAAVRREGSALPKDRFDRVVAALRQRHGWPLDTTADA